VCVIKSMLGGPPAAYTIHVARVGMGSTAGLASYLMPETRHTI
jgi:hypothetical protein